MNTCLLALVLASGSAASASSPHVEMCLARLQQVFEVEDVYCVLHGQELGELARPGPDRRTDFDWQGAGFEICKQSLDELKNAPQQQRERCLRAGPELEQLLASTAGCVSKPDADARAKCLHAALDPLLELEVPKKPAPTPRKKRNR